MLGHEYLQRVRARLTTTAGQDCGRRGMSRCDAGGVVGIVHVPSRQLYARRGHEPSATSSVASNRLKSQERVERRRVWPGQASGMSPARAFGNDARWLVRTEQGMSGESSG